jgi:hypothetical protein
MHTRRQQGNCKRQESVDIFLARKLFFTWKNKLACDVNELLFLSVKARSSF